MKNFLEKVQKEGPAGKKKEDRKGNRTRQKNKRGDSKVESNDSPEIPDRGETSDIRGLPSGLRTMRNKPKQDLEQIDAHETCTQNVKIQPPFLSLGSCRTLKTGHGH